MRKGRGYARCIFRSAGGGRPFLGTFIQSAAPEFVEAAGYAGFRFLTVDLEHTYYGPEKTVEMVRAGEAADLCVLAYATPS